MGETGTMEHECCGGPASLRVVYELDGLMHYVEANRCCAEMIPDTEIIPAGAQITEVCLRDANGETLVTPGMIQTTEYTFPKAS